jgi:hypothetical protein
VTDHARTPLPRLTSRAWVVTAAVVLAIPPAVAAWAWATRPDDRPWVLALAAVELLFVAGVSRRRWLEHEPAALADQLLWVWTRRVPLAAGTSVALQAAGSTVNLVARRDGTTGRVDVLALTEYVRRSRDAAGLEALAAALAGSGASGAADVARRLREQAAHERAGGDPGESPLARTKGARPLGFRY